MMNRLVSIALSVAAMFLVVMAILVNSPPLFYMTTAVLALLGAARLQAWLAVRGLRFDREAPPSVSVGEQVTVELAVTADSKVRRPLLTIVDHLPPGLRALDRTPSLPVAPAFGQRLRTRYSFRPMRRGRFSWRQVTVHGSDALGVISMEKVYTTEAAHLTVHPVAIPIGVELRPEAGWGLSDLETGRTKGSGLEPQGVREYVFGDPQRFVHWRSTARTGRLMVKEFESGSGVTLALVLQRKQGTDIGGAGLSTFEAMCGHALFIAEQFLKKGATVLFPVVEGPDALLGHPDARMRAVREVLTDLQPEMAASLADDTSKLRLPTGATLVLFLAVQDALLPDVLAGMSDVRRIALVYDAAAYAPTGGLPRTVANAADPTYLARLEAAGVEVHVTEPVLGGPA